MEMEEVIVSAPQYVRYLLGIILNVVHVYDV